MLNINNTLSNKNIKTLIQQQFKSAPASYRAYQCRSSGEAGKRILLLAVDKNLLDQAINLFNAIGLKPNSIEAEPFAALRLLPKDNNPHLLIIEQGNTLLLCLCQDGQLTHCKNIPATQSSHSITQEIMRYKNNNPGLSTAWLHTNTQTHDALLELLNTTTEVKILPLNELLKSKSHPISTSLAQKGFI